MPGRALPEMWYEVAPGGIGTSSTIYEETSEEISID